ncbi:hypothetical protein [Dongia sp. agr-C8]
MAQDIGATGVQFQVGRVISTSLAVFGRNLGPFMVIALIIGIPYLLVSLMTVSSIDVEAIQATGQLPSGFWGMVVIGILIYMLTYALTQAALVYGTVQDLRGQKASFGDCLSRGLAVLPRVLIVALLASIGIWIGSLLLLVPGVILMVMWWIVNPVLVVEGAGVGEAFSRSRELTRGHRWQIFGILLLVGVVYWVASFVLGMIGGAIGMLGQQILSAIVMLFFSAFASVLTAVGYYYLRAEKEGIIIDDLAKVFD